MLVRESAEFRGDPWAYSLIRCILWILLLLFTFLDSVFWRTASFRKYPLYIIVVVALVLQVIQNSSNFALTYSIQQANMTVATSNSSLVPLAYVNSITDAINETMELCLIMLISSGWGVIFTHLRPVHRTILSSGIIILAVLQFFLTFTNPRSPLYAYWVLLWLITSLVIWIYVVNMIYLNHKYLSSSARFRATPHSYRMDSADAMSDQSAGSSEFVVARMMAAEQGRRELHSHPTYLKRTLYTRCAIFVGFYILTQFLAHAVLTALIIFSRGYDTSLYWLFTFPRDLLDILLFACLCYLFRLREDNPYFPIPDSDYSAPSFTRLPYNFTSAAPSVISAPESTSSQRTVVPEDDTAPIAT